MKVFLKTRNRVKLKVIRMKNRMIILKIKTKVNLKTVKVILIKNILKVKIQILVRIKDTISKRKNKIVIVRVDDKDLIQYTKLQDIYYLKFIK